MKHRFGIIDVNPSILNIARKSVELLYRRMKDNCKAYGHDRSIVNSTTIDHSIIPWHRSEAKNLLCNDVKDGLHKTMKPSVLCVTRDEYKVRDSKVFRNQIYQECIREEKKAF